MSTSNEARAQCWCSACEAGVDGEDHRCNYCRFNKHGEMKGSFADFSLIDDHGFNFVLRGSERVPFDEYVKFRKEEEKRIFGINSI